MTSEPAFYINANVRPDVCNKTNNKKWTIQITPPEPDSEPSVVEKTLQAFVSMVLLIILFATVKYSVYVIGAMFAAIFIYYSVCEFILQ